MGGALKRGVNTNTTTTTPLWRGVPSTNDRDLETLLTNGEDFDRSPVPGDVVVLPGDVVGWVNNVVRTPRGVTVSTSPTLGEALEESRRDMSEGPC